MNFATATAAELAAAGYSVSSLPTKNARKGESWVNSIRGGSSRFYAATGAGRNGREQRLSNRTAAKRAV